MPPFFLLNYEGANPASLQRSVVAVVVADTPFAAYVWPNDSRPYLAPPDGVCRLNCGDSSGYAPSTTSEEEIAAGFLHSPCAQSPKCASGVCGITGAKDNAGQLQVCCMSENYIDMYADNPTADVPAMFVNLADGRRLAEALSASAITIEIAKAHRSMDPSALLLWLWGVAVVTTACVYAASRELRDPVQALQVAQGPPEEPEEHVDVTAAGALLYLLLAVGVLIGLFFLLKAFPRLIVLFMIAAYCLASFTALMLVVFVPLFTRYCPMWNTRRLPPTLLSLPLSKVAAAASTVAIIIFWVVTRHQPWSWFLQNLLGVGLVCYFFRIVRLNSIKVSYVLLWCFLVYDVFMVFLSPLLFHSCVMCAVATAGQGSSQVSASNPTECDRTPDEHMPMIFMIPRFGADTYAILGLGDVVLPGLLLTFALRYDFARFHGRAIPTLTKLVPQLSYFLPTTGGYAVGLLAAFLANAFGLTINGVQGQPALLYLVPCTTLPFTAVAWRRGEFRRLWAGPPELTHRCERLRTSEDLSTEDDNKPLV